MATQKRAIRQLRLPRPRPLEAPAAASQPVAMPQTALQKVGQVMGLISPLAVRNIAIRQAAKRLPKNRLPEETVVEMRR